MQTRKVRAFYHTQQVWSLYNSVRMCDFVGAPLNTVALERFASYVGSVTGGYMSDRPVAMGVLR